MKENTITAYLYWDLMRSGDSAALQELHNMYYQYLFGAGFSLCLDREFTKDCIHDLFLGIWNHHDQMPEVTSVDTFLYKCLRRKIINILNKEQHLQGFVTSEEYEREFSYEEVVLAFQTEQSTRLKLENALIQLNKKQREIIKLRFFEHKKFEEIARQLNCERGTIYNHLHEAITQLRYNISSPYIP